MVPIAIYCLFSVKSFCNTLPSSLSRFCKYELILYKFVIGWISGFKWKGKEKKKTGWKNEERK